MDVEEAGVALAAGTGQHRALMRLVELLVGRKAHVAIDAENAAGRVAHQRQPGRVQRSAQRDEQGAERCPYLVVVDGLARLEPVGIVVAREAAEEGECLGAKAGKIHGVSLRA